jgi:hypothetical protein
LSKQTMHTVLKKLEEDSEIVKKGRGEYMLNLKNGVDNGKRNSIQSDK